MYDLRDGSWKKADWVWAGRLIASFAIALIFGFGIFIVLEAARPASGLISFSFLLVEPAAISAFVCFLVDPLGHESRRFYRRMPRLAAPGYDCHCRPHSS